MLTCASRIVSLRQSMTYQPMEKTQDVNKEFKEEINKIFADCSKEIGNNRQQLALKMLRLHQEINKELSKTKIDAKREKEIRSEVAGMIKMAAQQLPHLKLKAPQPTTASAPSPPAKMKKK